MLSAFNTQPCFQGVLRVIDSGMDYFIVPAAGFLAETSIFSRTTMERFANTGFCESFQATARPTTPAPIMQISN